MMNAPAMLMMSDSKWLAVLLLISPDTHSSPTALAVDPNNAPNATAVSRFCNITVLLRHTFRRRTAAARQEYDPPGG
jgi:hypothetical protein